MTAALGQELVQHLTRPSKKGLETVASVAVFRDGKLLMGQRRDDKKWCCPGGHLEAGEKPDEGARRELLEETGLDAAELEQLGSKKVKNGEILVHSFRGDVDGEPSNADDPDGEFLRFRWVNPRALPDDVAGALHNNPDVTLELLKSEGDGSEYLGLLQEES